MITVIAHGGALSISFLTASAKGSIMGILSNPFFSVLCFYINRLLFVGIFVFIFFSFLLL